MAFEYQLREFGPDTELDIIRDWLEKAGNDGWEAVSLLPMLHMQGGGLIGSITIPANPRFGYTILMKRAKA